MTTYPFVPAWFSNLGPRKGGTLGLLYHLAEGGGTVGYLDNKGNPPPRGVSVHAVCEYSGRVVQMLKWGDASGSLNPADRSTDKTYFGHSTLVDVLGDWWRDPNSAVLSMEIEGFAKTGPNGKQIAGAVAWGLDMRSRFPSIRGAIGHADQTDTKRCPGATPPMRAIFDGVGGHGLFTEDQMYPSSVTRVPATPTLITIPSGTVLYDNSDLKASTANVTTSKARDMPLTWSQTTPEARVVNYVDEAGTPTGRAYWVVDKGFAQKPVPVVPGPALPPSAVACKPFTDPITARLTTANQRIASAATNLGATPPAPI